jgi:hypothetical protein
LNPRFLADENIDPDILQGLRAREPAIDILDVKSAGLSGIPRPSNSRRIIVPTHPSAAGQVIESLLLMWSASRPDEWRNQVVYLPFR